MSEIVVCNGVGSYTHEHELCFHYTDEIVAALRRELADLRLAADAEAQLADEFRERAISAEARVEQLEAAQEFCLETHGPHYTELQARIEQLENALNITLARATDDEATLRRELAEATRERDDLVAGGEVKNRHFAAERSKYQARVEQLEAERDRLRAALEEIAAMSKYADPFHAEVAIARAALTTEGDPAPPPAPPPPPTNRKRDLLEGSAPERCPTCGSVFRAANWSREHWACTDPWHAQPTEEAE